MAPHEQWRSSSVHAAVVGQRSRTQLKHTFQGLSRVYTAVHDVTANQVFDAIVHAFPVVRVKTKPRLSKNERQSGRGLHGACDSIIIIEEPCSSVGEGVVQVNVDGVKAAQ